MLGVMGLFSALPALTIDDDARFAKRSVQLDVTKNFMSANVVKKLIQLMKMYKLNNLVLNLADDYGWRLQMPARMKFDELVNVSWFLFSERCMMKPIRNYHWFFNPLPNKPWFLRVWSTSLLKTLWKRRNRS